MLNKKIDLNKPGFFSGLIIQLKLVILLMKDRRINPLLKLLPFAGILYLVFPDLLIGPVDDAVILFGGSYLFVELCPSAIVAEHMHKLHTEHSKSRQEKQIDENVIDGEFRDMDEK